MKNLFTFIFGLLYSGALAGMAQNVPPLINYQGRLTDAAGGSLPDGGYRVVFRLWNDSTDISTNMPTHLIWGHEYNVTLIQGAFNVILGANGGTAVPGAAVNDLSFALGDSNRFLGITIAQTPAGTISLNQQREILPRQQLLSVPFAMNAAVAASVAPGSIDTASLQSNLIQTTNLADGQVTLAKLALRQTLTNIVEVGGVAVSPAVTAQTSSGTYEDITELAVTITTLGRPIHVMLVPDSAGTNDGYASFTADLAGNTNQKGGAIKLTVDDSRSMGEVVMHVGGAVSSVSVIDNLAIPPSLNFIDVFSKRGIHTYKVQFKSETLPGNFSIRNVRLVAYEL